MFLLNMDETKGKKLKCVLWHVVVALAIILAVVIVFNVVSSVITAGDGADGTNSDGVGNNNWVEPPTSTGPPSTTPNNTFEPTSKQWVEPPTSSWGGVTSPDAIRV